MNLLIFFVSLNVLNGILKMCGPHFITGIVECFIPF